MSIGFHNCNANDTEVACPVPNVVPGSNGEYNLAQIWVVALRVWSLQKFCPHWFGGFCFYNFIPKFSLPALFVGLLFFKYNFVPKLAGDQEEEGQEGSGREEEEGQEGSRREDEDA